MDEKVEGTSRLVASRRSRGVSRVSPLQGGSTVTFARLPPSAADALVDGWMSEATTSALHLEESARGVERLAISVAGARCSVSIDQAHDNLLWGQSTPIAQCKERKYRELAVLDTRETRG